jgi:asparagine synthase (glutamine-hydrolysing)
MCGLSVIINKKRHSNTEDYLKAMNDKIVHRGPDDSGVSLIDNVGFGFRRLSILDLTDHGHQPMTDHHNNWVVFNGEIFNYVELRKELIAEGEIFKTETDTEVVLTAYRKWGIDCFSKFNGMWGIVLYDPSMKRVVVSRDRFGIKPLYFWDSADNLIFCSEIKQLTALPFFKPRLNQESAARFLIKRQLNTAAQTFFEEVHELAPGHNLIYELESHDFTVKEYYNIEDVKPNKSINFEDAGKEFYRLFEQAVSIRLRSDVPIGSCLSGGLDSSSIVSMAGQLNANNLSATTISACWSDQRFDEQEYIDEVIKKSKFESLKIFPNINELKSKNLLSDIVYHQDQPIKSASHFSEYAVFKAAKDAGLTVMLDGQGSDEFLAGYIPFRFYNMDLLKSGRFLKLFRELKFQQKNHYPLFSLITHNLKHILRTTGVDFTKLSSKNEKFFKKSAMDQLASRDQDRLDFSTYHQNSLNDIKYTSIPYQLHSEDRNSMMHSIESRLPFLDFELADFMLSLPDEMKMSQGTTKRILRESMRPILPEKITNRHSKKGFEAPEEPFVRKNNKWVREVIRMAIDCNPMLLNPNLLNSYDTMVSGQSPYDNVYFRILSYQIWAERFGIEN